MGYPYRESFVKHDLRKIKTDSKKEDKKYDFLFHINYNNVLLLAEMNPIRMKKFRELDQNTQSNVKRIDEVVEKSSLRVKELKAVAENTREKIESSLSEQIKRFGLEVKDVAEKLRVLYAFAKYASDEFDFYRTAVKNYEETLARIRMDQKLNLEIPSRTLLDLIRYLENKVASIRFMLNDVVETVKSAEDFDMRLDNSQGLYEKLMYECEVAVIELIEKSNEVLYMVRKTRVKVMGGHKPKDQQARNRIEEERPNADNIEDIIKKRLDRVISNFNK